MEDRKIRIGIIGTGFIGPAHIEAVRRLPGLEVTALADVDRPLAERKSAELGVDRAYGRYQDLLADGQIDSVHICTPNYLHFPIAREALESGKHVLCEKPLALTSGEGLMLVQLAERSGLAAAVHFNLRFYPLVRNLRAMVAEGRLGRLYSVHGSYLQDWLFHPQDYNWRLNPDKSGRSRAVADIGSHWMDTVEYVTGLRIARVCADLATIHPLRRRPSGEVSTFSSAVRPVHEYEEIRIETEDYAAVLFRFENGAPGAVVISQVSAGRKNRLVFEVSGARETAAWDSEAPNQLWIGRRDEANQLLLKDPALLLEAGREACAFPGGHQEGYPDTLKQFIRSFYGYIRRRGSQAGDPPPYPTFRDGLRQLVLCEAILESARTGGWVSLERPAAEPDREKRPAP